MSNPSTFICEFCNTEYSSKYSLKTHLEQTKKCLKLRDKTPDIIYNCEGCEHSFSTKGNLVYHQKTCVLFTLKMEMIQLHLWTFKTPILVLKNLNNLNKEFILSIG